MAKEKKDIEKFINRIDEIEKDKPEFKALLESYKEILTEQEKLKDKIKVKPIEFEEKILKAKTENGFPLVDKEMLDVDFSLAEKLFKKISEIMGKKNKQTADALEKIKKAIKDKEMDLNRLFKEAVADKDTYIKILSTDKGLNKEVISFLARNSIKPIVEKNLEQLKKYINKDLNESGNCPVCGSKPSMAELRGESGERILLCSLCGNEWWFKRIKCPFCGNEDSETLRYFHVEGEKASMEGSCRVDVCDKCKKYIKTVDSRKLQREIFLFIEDLGTIHLNLLAEEEGYTKDTDSVLGI